MLDVADRLAAFKSPKGGARRPIPAQRTLGLLRRWSTPNQNDNFSNSRQFSNMEHRCTSLGYATRLYDAGQVSGGDLTKNLDAIHLLQDIQDGAVHGIGVVSLDRLSREATGSDLAFILQVCLENDAIIVTETQELDPHDASHMLQAKMQGSVASLQRSTIRDTMVRGKAGRLLSGPITNAAGAPLGYCHVPTGEVRANGRVTRRIEKCPEGSYDRQIIETFWEIAKDAPSLIAVAREMNRRGLLYPRRRKVATKGQRVDWDHQLTRLVVEKEIYTGWIVFNNDTPRDIWRNQPEFNDGPVRRYDESLRYVDERTFWRVKERLIHKRGERDVAGVRGRNAPRPLFDIAHCLHCGAVMYNHHDRGPHWSYLCSANHTRKGSCVGQSVSERLYLGAVFSLIHDLSHQAREEAKRRASAILGADCNQELRDAQDRLAVLETRREKLIATIAALGPDPREMVTWQSQLKELREAIRQADADVESKAALVRHQDVLGSIPTERDAFLALVLDPETPWQLQRRFIQGIIQYVTVVASGSNTHRAARVSSFKFAGDDTLHRVEDISPIYAPRGMDQIPVSTGGTMPTGCIASLPNLPGSLVGRIDALLTILAA